MKRPLVLLGAMLLSCGLTGGGNIYANPDPQSVNQHSNTVTGTLKDSKGDPIVGASVQEEGTTRGAITDKDGNFTLKTAPNAKIVISYLGYKTITAKAKPKMSFTMEEDNALLDEIVVVGYGQQKKVNLTGSVANVDVDKTLGSRPEQDVAKALQGSVPGLTILNTSGDINSSPTMQIRGLGTLSNGQKSSPLIIVDGVPTDDLTMISGNDIANISVLKDAASSSIYGSRAAFGVILITTKQANKGDRVSVKYSGKWAWDNSTYLPDYPDVETQLTAAMAANERYGQKSTELFGMYFDKLLPYAKKWKEQHSGRKGYSKMEPYVDDNNVGDYYFNGSQPMYYADYDIQDIWYNNAAPSQSHDVSVSGSSGRTTFYTSLGYDAKEDVMKFSPSRRQRTNFTLNVKTDVTDWLTIGARANFTHRRFSRQNSYNNVYQYLWRWGSFFIPSGYIEGDDGTVYDYRVVAMQKQATPMIYRNDRIRLNGYLQAHITRDLLFNADFTYTADHNNFQSSNHSVYGMNWSGVKPTYIVQTSTTNATRDNTNSHRWVANAYLQYNHTFAENHNLGVMVGVNGEQYKSDYFYARRTQLYDENYPELNLAYGEMKNATITSSTADRSTAGWFGRINYDYKGIYLLELNGRYDGSSRFPEGDKWAFFPSVSLGYRFTEEPYWKDLHDYVSNGKVRFSYGEIGNEAVGDNMFLSTISAVSGSSSSNTSYWYTSSGSQVTMMNMPSWVSSSLTWERINTLDVGADLSFLKDDLTLTFDWYQRTTNDMLAPGKEVPKTVGASAPYGNSGSLRTRGWELSIAYRKQINKDFGVYGNFSIGDSKSVVTKWNNDAKTIGYTGGIVSDANAKANAYTGQVWGDIWGFETDRYFTEADFNGQNADGSWNYKDGVADQTGLQQGTFVFGPGDIKYKDLNGDGVIDGGKGTADDHGDLKVIGNTLPRYEYSFHLGGNWKGIDVDFFFQGVGKRDMWTTSSLAFPEMRQADLAIYSHQTKYNVYDPANGIVNISEDNDYPCLYAGNDISGTVTALSPLGGANNYYPQSKYLINMAYLRLKNITVGYTFPQWLTRKAYIQNVRVYASVDNLCLLYKGSGDLPIDPEINTGQGTAYGGWGRTYPITRSWSIGVQVTF